MWAIAKLRTLPGDGIQSSCTQRAVYHDGHSIADLAGFRKPSLLVISFVHFCRTASFRSGPSLLHPLCTSYSFSICYVPPSRTGLKLWCWFVSFREVMKINMETNVRTAYSHSVRYACENCSLLAAALSGDNYCCLSISVDINDVSPWP